MMTAAAAVAMAAVIIATGTANADVEAYQKAHFEREAVAAMDLVWDIDEGHLQEDATMEMLEEAEAMAEALHECDHKENLAVIADVAREELTRQTMTYYGSCRITGYCNCAKCCGIWAGGGTAGGTIPTAWRTVANGSLPFGTRVLIDGVEYIVEDRGVPGDAFDIYFDTHAEASAFGLHYTEVYILG